MLQIKEMKRNKQLVRNNSKEININIVFISKDNIECVELQNPLTTNRFKTVSQQKTIYNSKNQYFKQSTFPRNDSTNNTYNFAIPLNQTIDLNVQTSKNSTFQKKTLRNKKTKKQEVQLDKKKQKSKQKGKLFCKQLGYKNKIIKIYKLKNLENKKEVNVNTTISKKNVKNRYKQHKLSQQQKIIKEKRNNSIHNNRKNQKQKKKQRNSLSYIQKNKYSIFSKPHFIPFSQSQQDPTLSNQKSLLDNYQEYKQEIILFLHELATKIQKVWRGYCFRKRKKQSKQNIPIKLKKIQINQQQKQNLQNIKTATFYQKIDNQQAKILILQNQNQLNLIVYQKLSVQTQTETILDPYQINNNITCNEKYAQTILQQKKIKDQQIQVKSQKKQKYQLQSLPQYFLKKSKLLQIVQIGNQLLMMKQQKKIERIKKMYEQKFMSPKTFQEKVHEIHKTTKEKLSKYNKSKELFQIGWKKIFQNFLDIRNTINKSQNFHLSEDRSIIKQYKNNSYIFRQVLNHQIQIKKVDKHQQSFKNSEQQLSPIFQNQNILQILEQNNSFQKQIKNFNYITQTNIKNEKKKIQQIKSQYYLKQLENKIIEQLLIDFMKENYKFINKYFKKNKVNKINLFKGFDTSHDKVNQYLVQISTFILLKYKFQLCSRINQILGPKPQQILKLLRPYNKYQLKNHQFILPLQIYQQFQYNIMVLNIKKKNYSQQQGFQLKLIHLHNKVIFDAINQSLQNQRPYGIQGWPLPWKKIQKKQSNYRQITQMKNIMQEAINRVSSFCTYELGNHKMQGMQKEVYEEIKRSKVFEQELRQQALYWSNFEYEITQINEIISNHIYDQLIFQFVKIFYQ